MASLESNSGMMESSWEKKGSRRGMLGRWGRSGNSWERLGSSLASWESRRETWGSTWGRRGSTGASWGSRRGMWGSSCRWQSWESMRVRRGSRMGMKESS